MAMAEDEIVSLIKTALPDAEIEMIDLAGDNNHWKAIITSSAFIGQARVAQHQIVYAALKGSMDCLLYTSPSPRDATLSRMPSSA